MASLAKFRSIALVVATVGWLIDGGYAIDTTHRPDFTSDSFLVGSWTCEMTRGGKPAGHEVAHYAVGLDGRWLKLDYTLHPSGQRMGIRTEAYETFDGTKHQWMYVSMSSDGTWGVAYSTGWKNGSKVYMPAPDTPQTFKLVATKLTEDEFTEDGRQLASDGTWTIKWFLRCKRSAPAR